MQFSAGYAPMPMLQTRAQPLEVSVMGPPVPSLRPPAPALKPVASERPQQQPSAQRSAAPMSRSTSQELQAPRASTPNSMRANSSAEREQQQEKQFYSSTSTAAARAALMASAYASAAEVQPSYPSFACRTAPTDWHNARRKNSI
jgi:hypothetical protein